MGQELGTTLRSIRGSLALLASGAAGTLPPAAKELIGIAARNCERVIAQVDSLVQDETPAT